jgi:voltage-gated sodium channel
MQASQLQNRFEKIRSNKAFELFVIGVILFSALLVGAKTYDMPSTVNQITNLLDWFISAFFLVELTIRFFSRTKKTRFFQKLLELVRHHYCSGESVTAGE